MNIGCRLRIWHINGCGKRNELIRAIKKKQIPYGKANSQMEDRMDKLYIVIPAYNEQETIGQVAREWHRVAEKAGDGSRLVIVNDGSKDRTYEILCSLRKELPLLVPLTKENGGHGAAVLYGYAYAVRKKADYIFQTDADGQTLPGEFWKFWNRRHRADVLIGCRKHREDGVSRVAVTKVLRFVLWVIFGLDVTDANTPYRLMDRHVLERTISQVPRDFHLSNVMLSVLFLKNGERVEFIPITFRPRQGGKNSIGLYKITKIGIRAVRDFMVIRHRMEPAKGRGSGRHKNAGRWKDARKQRI